MIVGIKDAAKLIVISVIACCAVLVCTMFLNFYLDIRSIENLLASDQALLYYQAQVSTAKVVCLVSGGCLLITTIVTLIFYIGYYIDAHKKELGILKALGYSSFHVAKHFWVFGTSIFLGTAAGFAGAFLLMPEFYRLQNKDHILPEIAIRFHPALLMYLVALPTAFFALLSIFYALLKLRQPVLPLLKMSPARHATAKWALVFFIAFASFCFSSMTQMSAGMDELSSAMMGAMILVIGLILACTTLFLAVTTVVRGNTKTIALMRVFGYTRKECHRALLGGYRPVAFAGFALGTVYQYALLRLMVDLVFADFPGLPAYEFDIPVMLLSLAAFLLFYELMMHFAAEKIKRVPLGEIMME